MTEFHFTSQQPVTTLETDSFLLLPSRKFKGRCEEKVGLETHQAKMVFPLARFTESQPWICSETQVRTK